MMDTQMYLQVTSQKIESQFSLTKSGGEVSAPTQGLGVLLFCRCLDVPEARMKGSSAGQISPNIGR